MSLQNFSSRLILTPLSIRPTLSPENLIKVYQVTENTWNWFSCTHWSEFGHSTQVSKRWENQGYVPLGYDNVQFGIWAQIFQKKPVSSFAILNITTRRHVSQDTTASQTFGLKSLYIKSIHFTIFFPLLETFAFWCPSIPCRVFEIGDTRQISQTG